jgi:hypothetical protein
MIDSAEQRATYHRIIHQVIQKVIEEPKLDANLV